MISMNKLKYPILGILTFMIGSTILIVGLFVLSPFDKAYGFWGAFIGSIIALPVATIIGLHKSNNTLPTKE